MQLLNSQNFDELTESYKYYLNFFFVCLSGISIIQIQQRFSFYLGILNHKIIQDKLVIFNLESPAFLCMPTS